MHYKEMYLRIKEFYEINMKFVKVREEVIIGNNCQIILSYLNESDSTNDNRCTVCVDFVVENGMITTDDLKNEVLKTNKSGYAKFSDCELKFFNSYNFSLWDQFEKSTGQKIEDWFFEEVKL